MARWYRLLLTFLLSFFRPKILLTDSTTLFFRVFPFEADFKYMNNSSFWTIAEMGIMDIYFRSGAFKVCRNNHWMPLMTSQKIVYRKPLKRFERFQLRTRIIYWNDKWVYFNNTFLKNGQLIANCLINAVLISKKGKISPQDFMATIGIKASPQSNDIIEKSNNIDQILLDGL